MRLKINDTHNAVLSHFGPLEGRRNLKTLSPSPGESFSLVNISSSGRGWDYCLAPDVFPKEEESRELRQFFNSIALKFDFVSHSLARNIVSRPSVLDQSVVSVFISLICFSAHFYLSFNYYIIINLSLFVTICFQRSSKNINIIALFYIFAWLS